MQISFEHCNPHSGHESTLLHFDTANETRHSFLIDAGVGTAGHIEDIDGLLLTHSHCDHYQEVPAVLEQNPEVPLYTSRSTGNILEQTFAEADQHHPMGDISLVSDRLTPIETWTRLAENIDVLPVPAGHAPGAVGFLFRVLDIQNNTETPMLLVTGDFTTHPVAGNSGLTLPPKTHVDVMIVNAATAENYDEAITRACRTILEHAFGGSTTLVAASGLTGVHLAYLLGHLLQELERTTSLTIVGQAAKLYDDLSYDVPNVEVHPDFTDTNDVLSSGGITIAGPESPTKGSTGRLFGVIRQDPSSAFVQVSASEPDLPDGTTCSTYHVPLIPHPETEEFVELAKDYFPRHLVVKHTSMNKDVELGEEFENFFFWSNDDTEPHLLYDDGEWASPEWVSDGHADRIQARTYRKGGKRRLIDQERENLPQVDLNRQQVDLKSEGVDVEELTETFRTPENPYPATEDDPTTSPEQKEAGATSKSEGSEITAAGATEAVSTTTDGGAKAAEGETLSSQPTECEASLYSEEISKKLDEIDERLASLEGAIETKDTEATVIEENFGTQLNEIDERLETLSTHEVYDVEEIDGTIIDHDDLLLIRLLKEEESVDTEALSHGQSVTVSLSVED